MTKLETLIAELCPNGVEYLALSEVCKLSAGGDVPKEALSNIKTDKFNVPIFSNGIGENALYGWTDKARINEPCVTIAARGTIGYSALHLDPFVPIIRLVCAIPNDKLDVKFLKHTIEMIPFQVPTSGIPQLTVPMVGKYKIPLPPLEIQREIVKILDNFAELTAELTADVNVN
jgi:type I restriction enzyme S subunit